MAIRSPSVPPRDVRLRATVMDTHTDADIDLAVEVFTDAHAATAI